MSHPILTSTLLLATALFLVPTASAEVFRCKNADGTTEFSHTPCRVHAPKAQSVTPEPQPMIELDLPPRDLAAEISAIEQKLDELRIAREQEIANAPYSTSNPELLNDVKAQIRASYQLKIDENLSELVHLRTELQRSRRGSVVSAQE
jgi:hypothetical protein